MKDKVCLLITVFNRTPQLIRSLQRLNHLTLPDEILIVDDGSTSGLEQELKQFDLPIRYIYNHNPDWSICSMARNIGIKNTDCDIVITCEPEILFITDNVKEMITLHYQNPNKVINVGTIYHQGKDGVTHQDTIDKGWLDLSMVNNSDHNTNPKHSKGHAKIQNWVAPFCALYRREWLMSIGGWDEEFVKWGFDDTDLLTRLRVSKLHINQITDINLEAVHQYHDKLPPDAQRKACLFNEKRMMDKNLNDGGEDNPYIIANQNKEWGVIIPRN